MNSTGSHSWLQTAAGWLTPRRLYVHAACLALCAWTLIAADFAVPGSRDRVGNLKFQDFLAFYIAGRQIDRGETGNLYDREATAHMQEMVGKPNSVELPFLYGPQVGALFVPISRLSFLPAAVLWTSVCTILYFFCCYGVWRLCPGLRGSPGLVVLAALAFPPFFSFFVRGQISALVLALFVAAFFAFQSGNEFLAGFALGTLVFKPQFLGMLPIVALARAWKTAAGMVAAIVVQLGAAWLGFGTQVMRAYLEILRRLPQIIAVGEPGSSQAQMHSLRSFWLLLSPRSELATGLYALCSAGVIILAAISWQSRGSLSLRFSSLVLASVLIDPHLFVYGLLVLAPVVLLLSDWIVRNQSHPYAAALTVCLYLSYVLPLLGPLTRWTHLQLSVPVFVVLQWLLWRVLQRRAIPEVVPAAAFS